MDNMSSKRCSRCKLNKFAKDFGIKKNGEEYKTCVTCRDSSTKLYIQSKDKFLNLRPFVDISHIKYTFEQYGYKTILVGNDPIAQSWMYNPIIIESMLLKTKSVIVINYVEWGNEFHDYVINKIDPEMLDYVLDHAPCVICAFSHKFKIITCGMKYCNSFEHFFKISKLPHIRRCCLCCEKERKFVNCFRCDNRLCLTCFQKCPNLICPYCNYDIQEHSEYMDKLYALQ